MIKFLFGFISCFMPLHMNHWTDRLFISVDRNQNDLMAADQEVITVEPIQKDNPTFQQEKLNEEIIIEGVPQTCEIRKAVCFNHIIVAGAVPIAFLLLIPLSIYVCMKVAKTWKLYVTKNAIHYSKVNSCFWCCGHDEWVIPFSYIKNIYAYEGTIYINMEQSQVDEFLHCCYQPICGADTLILNYVANAEDIVAAVKRQMSADK